MPSIKHTQSINNLCNNTSWWRTTPLTLDLWRQPLSSLSSIVKIWPSQIRITAGWEFANVSFCFSSARKKIRILILKEWCFQLFFFYFCVYMYICLNLLVQMHVCIYAYTFAHKRYRKPTQRCFEVDGRVWNLCVILFKWF